ncbi:MAG TPA: hypothetical protein VFZ66_15225 [Herpetosiphonaceae bacterium]
MTAARWTKAIQLLMTIMLAAVFLPTTRTSAMEETYTVRDLVVIEGQCYALVGTHVGSVLQTLEVSNPAIQACITETETMPLRLKPSSVTGTNEGYLLSADRCFKIVTAPREAQEEVDRSLCDATIVASPMPIDETEPRRQAGYDAVLGGCVNTVVDVHRDGSFTSYFTPADVDHCVNRASDSADNVAAPTEGIFPRRIESRDDVPIGEEITKNIPPVDRKLSFDTGKLKMATSISLTVAVVGNNYKLTANTGCCFEHHYWYLYRNNSLHSYLGYTPLFGNQIVFYLPLTTPAGTYRVELDGYIWDNIYGGYLHWALISNDVTLPLPVSTTPSVTYQAHVQSYGWLGWVTSGQVAGTTGQSRRMEAAQIKLQNMPGASVCYQAHVRGKGWLSSVCNGATGGTTGESRRMEAIKVWLVGAPSGCNINYQAHVQGHGWLGSVSNGATAGTTGQSRRMEALKVWLSGSC